MVLKTKTNLIDINGATYLRIPKDLMEDSQFPFSLEDSFSIEYKDDKLQITKEEV